MVCSRISGAKAQSDCQDYNSGMARSSKESLLKRLKAESEGLLIDLLQLIGFILLLWIGELLVNKTVGEVLLFDKYPVRWLFHASDVGLVTCFTIRACRRLLR